MTLFFSAAMLLLIVLGMTTWVFNRSLGPVYRLLQWLDGYTLGGRNEALPEASSIDEFRRLYAAVHQTCLLYTSDAADD